MGAGHPPGPQPPPNPPQGLQQGVQQQPVRTAETRSPNPSTMNRFISRFLPLGQVSARREMRHAFVPSGGKGGVKYAIPMPPTRAFERNLANGAIPL